MAALIWPFSVLSIVTVAPPSGVASPDDLRGRGALGRGMLESTLQILRPGRRNRQHGREDAKEVHTQVGEDHDGDDTMGKCRDGFDST